MKRFTDTNKWRDAWFMNLSPKLKTVWLFLVDNCDHAGIIEANVRLIGFSVGMRVKHDEIMTAMQGRLIEFKPGKWLVKPFIKFQYGQELNPENSAHQGVIKRLTEYGLESPVPIKTKGAAKPLDSPLQRAKDKDKDKDKDQDQKDRGVGEGLVIPEKFGANEEFLKEWETWKSVRRAKKSCKDFNRLFQSQLEWLSAFTVPQAIESLGQSIRNDWQGLFEPKSNNGHTENGNGKLTGAQTMLYGKELDRVQNRIKTIVSQYDGHQTKSPEDRAELLKLRAREKELMSMLGCLL